MLISIILSILLLAADSRSLFILAIFFWLLATLLRLLGVDIWAERSSVYFYEALFVGVLLFIIKETKHKNG
jgi:hypothetical protein